MEKIDNLPYSPNWIEEINSRIHRTEIIKSSLIEEFEEVNPDIIKWFDDIIDELKMFKKVFLNETEQKTRKPHEKWS